MSVSKSGYIDIDHQAIFDANPDVSFILGTDGRILDVNRAAVKCYGYSLTELKQMTVSDLTPADIKLKIISRFKKPLKSSEVFESTQHCKDGSELPVEMCLQPIIVDGEAVIFLRAREISDRKTLESELQNNQQFLERILDTEPGTVYIYDLIEQRNVYVNRHWLSAFGYAPEETQAMGADLIQIFHPDDLLKIVANHQAWRTAPDDETRTIEFRIRAKQGDWHWLIGHETAFSRDKAGLVNEILGISYDITEQKKAENDLARINRQHINMLESMTDGFVELDRSWCFRYLNNKAAELFGREQSSLIGKHIWTEFPEAVSKPFYLHYEKAMAEQQVIIFEDYYSPWDRWFENRVYPSQDGLIILFQDISDRKRAETLLHGQNLVLEMIAAGLSLHDSLDTLLRIVEELSPGMMGSILLLDADGVQVRHCAAPSLSAEFVAAVDGQPGPIAGSCGTAAYRKEAVFVEDINTDPLWANYNVVALPHGLRACWFTPVFDEQQQVLGIFAMYCRQPGLPKPGHLQLINTVTDVAAIAIINHRKAAALGKSETRLLKAQRLAHMGFLEWNLKENLILCSDEVCTMYGLDPDAPYMTPDFVWKVVHPDDLDYVKNNLDLALRGVKGYNIDHRIKRSDGKIIWLHAHAELVLDTDGNAETLLGTIVDITERKLAEAKVRRLTQLYAALSQCNQAIVRCTSEAELFPSVCHDAVNFGGMKLAVIAMLDEPTGLVKPVASFGSGIEYLEGLEISVDANNPTGQGPSGIALRENRPYWCQDFQHDPVTAAWHEHGSKFGWGSVASLPLHRREVPVGVFLLYTDAPNTFDDEVQKLLIEMAIDISYALNYYDSNDQRKKAEEALQVSENYLRTIIETEPECVTVIDKTGKLRDINAAGLAMLELESVEEARLHNLLDFILPEYKASFEVLFQSVMSGGNAVLEFEITGLRGTRRWLETHTAPLRETGGEIYALLCITQDITERKRAEQHIAYLANYDALTGLPNRTQLDQHLKYALSLVKRSKGKFAMMFIDVDRFKDINDTLGHRIGDAFLIEIARRLQSDLREEDTASRLGGDEFILMLPNCDARGATQVAEKLLQVIAQPYRIEQYDLNVTASIGIAIYPDDGEDLETLSKSADTAMYRAKNEGRNGYRFFTAEMQESATRNMELTNSLRHALARNQFQIHYQPQISIHDGHIIGVEALLRWHHPELGDVSPAEFILVAEDSGLILPIGEWVLRTAVQQLKRWMDSGHAPMVMAVNLSAVQFRHPSLPELVSSILEEEQLPPEYLELELTEGVAMHDPLGAIAVMDSLHEHGIRLSIDDFGTGYSSLNYLKKFKVYKIKIDQSFVHDITTDLEDKAIVAAIISMAKSLGLKTIAEGVESGEQLAFLRKQGCDEVQGYYVSKPLSADQLEYVLDLCKA